MRKRGALPVVLLCLLAPGCGDGGRERAPQSPKERYEGEFKQTIRDWQERGEREVPEVPDTAPLPEQAKGMRVAVEVMGGLAADLARIDAPAEIRRAHRDHARGLRLIAGDLRDVVGAMARDDCAAVERSLSGSGFAEQDHVALVARARLEFQRKDYDLGIAELAWPGRTS